MLPPAKARIFLGLGMCARWTQVGLRSAGALNAGHLELRAWLWAGAGRASVCLYSLSVYAMGTGPVECALLAGIRLLLALVVHY